MKDKIAIFLFVLFMAYQGLAFVINIPADYSTIQNGINASTDGDTVLVQPGAYIGDINFNGKNITVASWFIITQDTTLIEQTMIIGTGNTSVVKFMNNETNAAVLSGLTITGGTGYEGDKGGGIYCINSNPNLSNLIVAQNHVNGSGVEVNDGGGGIYLEDSDNMTLNKIRLESNINYFNSEKGAGLYVINCENIELYDCIIEDNEINSNNQKPYGGGICIQNSNNIQITSSTIKFNDAKLSNSLNGESFGGGISIINSNNIDIYDCNIDNNEAYIYNSTNGKGYGGGISITDSEDIYISNNIINSNKAKSANSQNGKSNGGGIYFRNTIGIIINENDIMNNNAELLNNQNGSGCGAGVYIYDCNITISKTTIANNIINGEYAQKGGGLYITESILTLINSNIIANVSNESNGIYNSYSIINMNSCIVWNNEIVLSTLTSNLTLNYCDIENGEEGIINEDNAGVYWLGVNIDEVPLFVDAENGDYHLMENSPCIDAGNPYLPYDPDDTIADIGAYYFHQGSPVVEIIDFSGTPLNGVAPLEVQFEIEYLGVVDDFVWDFGDGNTSVEENPEYTYLTPGVFSVSVSISGVTGDDTLTKTDYIEVTEPEYVTADFELSGNYGCIPYEVEFTNLSVGTIDSLYWDFGDGFNSIESNPVHIYENTGDFYATLTVYGESDNDTKTELIQVGIAEPEILAIIDIPEDQGGWVNVNFGRSFYDSDTLRTAEGYTIEIETENGWTGLNSIYGYGEEDYNVIVHTPYDSTSTNNGLINFRVIAAMDEGNWVSEIMPGYSVDNIAPAIPTELRFEDGYMRWSEPEADDFAYFSVFNNGLFMGNCIEPEMSVIGILGEMNVIAYDCHGNESLMSENITGGYPYGDCDNNLEVEAFDASLVLQYFCQLVPEGTTLPWEVWRFEVADVDGNGVVEAYDASLILMYSVGLIDEFPVELDLRKR